MLSSIGWDPLFSHLGEANVVPRNKHHTTILNPYGATEKITALDFIPNADDAYAYNPAYKCYAYDERRLWFVLRAIPMDGDPFLNRTRFRVPGKKSTDRKS